MSVVALAPAPRLGRRVLMAAAALGLVGAAVALSLWILSGSAPPVAARSPFGTGLREGGASASGLAGTLLAWQAAFFAALRSALASVRDGGGVWALVGIGFGYGVFHAAGPGHGKAIISAYLVSSERALARGIAVSAAAALIQAAIAIGLVVAVFVLAGATAATMGRTAGTVEMAGFGLVAALGASLLWRKSGKLDAALAGTAGAAHPADCACAPIAAGHAGSSLGQMAGVALGAGIRPCAGAIVLLTLARSYGVLAAGMLATLAMAAGTALTTGALATAAVFAKRLALRLAAGRGRGAIIAGAMAELGAAALVLVIGVALLLGYWDGVAGS